MYRPSLRFRFQVQKSRLQQWLLSKLIGGRLYGDGYTIHSTDHVNVERDPVTGSVVAVWFRCSMLRFSDHVVDRQRSNEMVHAYKVDDIPKMTGIVFEDKPRG